MMKTQIENLDFVEIPELGIKVETKVSENMIYTEAEKYCKDSNARMLNVLQAGYIFDGDLIKDFCKQREWLEHYSKKTRKAGFGCSALDRSWNFDGRLDVYGNDFNDDVRYLAFRVRRVFPIDNKARVE